MTRIARKIPGLLLVVCVCVAAFLNTATVRRKQTAVSKAQTAGIKLKDKLEEVKDGEKGPATPSFGWYGGKDGFMSEPPFNKDKPESSIAAEVPPVSEVELAQPQLPSGEEYSEESVESWDDDWAEDEAKENEALPSTADTEEVTAQLDFPPEDADTSEDKKASKWDKDWWDEI